MFSTLLLDVFPAPQIVSNTYWVLISTGIYRIKEGVILLALRVERISYCSSDSML